MQVVMLAVVMKRGRITNIVKIVGEVKARAGSYEGEEDYAHDGNYDEAEWVHMGRRPATTAMSPINVRLTIIPAHTKTPALTRTRQHVKTRVSARYQREPE